VIAVAAGWYHSLALTANGRVAGWGSPAAGYGRSLVVVGRPS